ncbi:hypothetical protein JOD64_006487 [Micromonospora luteifusca]|uniref:Uncharacterized protein n=1 Tax=Micromonospora luteifusca TaxID=709860 RepID=A0ABS2M4K0_9ACTN|nr:hypothetical protein [Micromonospora luteifusca]MBM7495265.1 hypothetical protein [Micromonospora luteifusca]
MENTRMYADSVTAVPSRAPLPTSDPASSAPTPTTAVPTTAAPASSRRRLLWHLGEMALAMVAGMLLLGPLWELAGAALGVGDTLARPEVAALVMATNMTVGMTVGMRYRAHRWHVVGEMGAAMYVPFLLLLVPFRAGLIDADALLLGGHLLMIPAMVLVAVRHRHEASAPVRRHRVVVALAHRWPAGLALLMTVDMWVDPSVLSPWTMLVLPGGYLVIGMARRTLGGRGVLATQLAGLAVWVALTLVAVLAGGRTADWLVAFGWLAHAGWDLAHHRGRVVPRGYAEFCVVLDVALAAVMVLAILTTDA